MGKGIVRDNIKFMYIPFVPLRLCRMIRSFALFVSFVSVFFYVLTITDVGSQFHCS